MIRSRRSGMARIVYLGFEGAELDLGELVVERGIRDDDAFKAGH